MKTLAVFLYCIAASLAQPLIKEERGLEWAAWKTFHGKTYASEAEEKYRMGIWLSNMEVNF